MSFPCSRKWCFFRAAPAPRCVQRVNWARPLPRERLEHLWWFVWWILVRLGDYHIYWEIYKWIYTLKWLMISPLSTSILLKRAKIAKIHSGENLRLTGFGLKFQPESIRAVFSACRSCRYSGWIWSWPYIVTSRRQSSPHGNHCGYIGESSPNGRTF